MRANAPRVLRRFGIKRVVVWNTFIAAGFIAACGFFTQEMPTWIIFTMLLVGGFFRALQFTSLNSLAFADLPQRSMSKATSFTSVAQQLSISAGVAISAIALESVRLLRGDNQILADDFLPAFLVVGAISACTIFFLLPLPKNAGESLIKQPAAKKPHTTEPGPPEPQV